MNILHIDSSILGDNSVTRTLSADLTARFAQAPGAQVTYLDLASDPLEHLSGSLFAARAVDDAARNDAQRRDVAASDKALDDFLAADVIVIGAPMYNFSIPSQLKAWIDRVAQAGKTFRYTDKGPEGLAGGKKIVIVSSRGGYYGSDSGMGHMDFQEQYLKTVFGFLGVTDIEFVRAEGVNYSADHKAQAIASAQALIAGRDRIAA
jgi:FMN-dependent NADH-azoreductase